MSYTTPDFADDVIGALTADGYTLHALDESGQACAPEHGQIFWTTWCVTGADIEIGEDFDTELGAWASALQHRLANSSILNKDGKPLRASPPPGTPA